MRAKATAITVAVLLIALSGGVASAAAPFGEWHRLNPGVVNEHEHLQCIETTPHWTCRYDKLPEPGFQVDATVGLFTGRNITSTWTCPEWFDPQVCDSVVAVYEGRATYFLDGGGQFRTDQDYVVTNMSGHEVLIQYFVDQFACPWFRTFAEAVAANPDSQFDCALAP